MGMKTEISLSPEHLEVEHYYLPIFNGAKTKRANDEECTFKTMKRQKQLPLQIQHVPPDNKPMKTEISLSPEHLEVEHYYLPIFNGAKTKRANDEECTFKTMKRQ